MKLHVSPHTAQISRTFTVGVSLVTVALVSAISLATLVYVWFVL